MWLQMMLNLEIFCICSYKNAGFLPVLMFLIFLCVTVFGRKQVVEFFAVVGLTVDNYYIAISWHFVIYSVVYFVIF